MYLLYNSSRVIAIPHLSRGAYGELHHKFAEKREALARRVKSAMVYPLMVILVATGIVSFLLIKVVPTFAEIFSDLGGALPGPTQILVNISEFLKTQYLKLIAYIVMIGDQIE